MFCENCGKQIPDGSAFCPECGANLTRHDPDDESTVLLTSDYSSTYSSSYPSQGYDYSRPPGYDPYYSPNPPKKDNSKRIVLIIALVLAIIALTVAAIFVIKKVTSSDKEDTKTEEVEDKSKNKKKEKKAEAAEEKEDPEDSVKPVEEAPVEEPAETIPEEPVRAAAPQVSMNTVSATASDHLNETQLKNPINHVPSLVIDGNVTTAWAVQNSRSGVGDYVTLNLGGTYTVSGFDIYAGHHKSQDLYMKNCRPSRVTAIFSDGTSQTFVLNDVMTMQRQTLSKPVETTSVTFRIDDAYIGNKYPKDMCVSEISLF